MQSRIVLAKPQLKIYRLLEIPFYLFRLKLCCSRSETIMKILIYFVYYFFAVRYKSFLVIKKSRLKVFSYSV